MKNIKKLMCIGLLSITAYGTSIAASNAPIDPDSTLAPLPAATSTAATASTHSSSAKLVENFYSKIAGEKASTITLPPLCPSGGCTDAQRQEIKKNLKIFTEFLGALSFTLSDNEEGSFNQRIIDTSNAYREKLNLDLSQDKARSYDQYCSLVSSLKLLSAIVLAEKK
jgi:hypothetical protein